MINNLEIVATFGSIELVIVEKRAGIEVEDQKRRFA
jgi:hypothetical protein